MSSKNTADTEGYDFVPHTEFHVPREQKVCADSEHGHRKPIYFNDN